MAALSGVLFLHPCSALSQDRDSDQKTVPQFSAKVEQVVLYAAVYDAQGQLVSTVPRDDFRIYEDQIEQEITYFGLDDIPSSIGIVMDKSGSMRGKFTLVNEAAELFLKTTNPANEFFLMAFDDEVELEEPFTNDVEDIRDGLFNLIVSGGTALYDAIYLAVDEVQEGKEPKKALVVFTDGEDKDSYYTDQELLEKVREADVQIFVVAFLDEDLSEETGFFGIFKSEREKVEKVVTSIAEETGGKAFFPEKLDELDDVFKAIAYDLRNQYRIAYVSTNPDLDGKWRRIKVEVEGARQKGLRVRAKKGYYAKATTP